VHGILTEENIYIPNTDYDVRFYVLTRTRDNLVLQKYGDLWAESF
jgi:predicted nucleotidyltransferase